MSIPARIFILLIIAIVVNACNNAGNELKSGNWRATVKTASGVEIPFNFVVSDSAGKKQLNILNGNERFKVNNVSLKNDSVIIKMPLFDSEIKAKLYEDALRGKWIRHLAGKDLPIDFYAESGISWRFFKADNKAKHNVSGRWSAIFTNDTKDTTITVAEFEHKANKVTGTFLTTTGDYRFLEGTVSGDKLFLSCFDGAHAYLFTGKLNNDSTITDGKFYSGYSAVENWTARKDEKAVLPDAYSLTALKPGFSKLDFSFTDINTNKVSLSDSKFQNKVVIVQFMGSWCPNCMDETAYLSPFYKKYKSKGVEVIGLAYERTPDFAKSKENILKFKNRFNVEYPLLITGYTNRKEEVVKSLPMLNAFRAFPTTIIIDKKQKVRKIHTGFNGPATGNHYTEFIREFEKLINDLLKEQ